MIQLYESDADGVLILDLFLGHLGYLGYANMGKLLFEPQNSVQYIV